MAQAKRCSELKVYSEPVAVAPKPTRACSELDGNVFHIAGDLEAACRKKQGAMCALLGNAYLGYRTRKVLVGLVSPRCKSGQRCHGRHSKVVRMALRMKIGRANDNTKAARWLKAACDAGTASGCVELAELRMLHNKPGHEPLLRRACQLGHPASCSEVLYRNVRTVLTEQTNLRHGVQLLTRKCSDSPTAAYSCNSLGFLVERGLVKGQPARKAFGLYQKACSRGSIEGCANLIFFGVNRPRATRRLKYRDVAKLAEGCNSHRGEPDDICTAWGIALKRGLGIKRQFRKGAKLLRKVCKTGYRSACGI